MCVKRYTPILFLSIILISCKLKTKTELYLERDLDILSNKKEVNFSFTDKIVIKEIGIIRDKKENQKTLVFKMGNSLTQEELSSFLFRIEAIIKGNRTPKRTDKWEFKPILTEVNKNKYILKKIDVKEDKIQKLTIELYKHNKKVNDKELIVKNLYTYND